MVVILVGIEEGMSALGEASLQMCQALIGL